MAFMGKGCSDCSGLQGQPGSVRAEAEQDIGGDADGETTRKALRSGVMGPIPGQAYEGPGVGCKHEGVAAMVSQQKVDTLIKWAGKGPLGTYRPQIHVSKRTVSFFPCLA